jgi:hypothetical protein
MINIEDLTLKQIREIQKKMTGWAVQYSEPYASPDSPYITSLVSKNVIVRTVTMIYTGKLLEVTPTDFILVDCSWIPETDRFAQFVANGSVRECEPYPEGLPVAISRGAYLDMCELKKDLPRSQK